MAHSRKPILGPSPLPHLKADISKFPLTYMQASKYKGPIVEGWPPERNRSLDLYILPEEDTFPLKPKSEAVKKILTPISHGSVPAGRGSTTKGTMPSWVPNRLSEKSFWWSKKP